MGCNVQRDGESFRTRIIKWSRRRAGPPLHNNIYNIYIHVTHRPVCSAPQTGLRGVRPIVCTRREGKKNLTETHPLPSLITVVVHTTLHQHHSPLLTRVTAFTLLNFYTEVNEQNENCVHTVYGILCLCVFVYVLCIRSPRIGRLASGVLMKGVVVV